MTPARFALAAMAAALVMRGAAACPCQGSSGAGGSVTTESERFGSSLTETARWVDGLWGPHGEFASLPPGGRVTSLDFTLLVGYRPVPKIEITAETAFGHESAALPYLVSTRTGLGDVVLRVRWDAADELAPFTRGAPPWPAVSFVAATRAPTAARGTTTVQGVGSADTQGPAFSGRTGSAGASASSEGLGAWEASAAAIVAKSLGTEWLVSALGEAAYRFPDTWTGIPRHLGPRLFGQAGARYSPSAEVSVGVLTDFGWEGDVAFEGDTVPQSSQRLWTVSGYFLIKPPKTGYRWGILARTAPHVPNIGNNAVAATSVGVSVGYAME